MNYATGYAFNAKEVVANFSYKKIKLTHSECEEIIGSRHREYIVEKLLKYCIKLVLDDIIHNNVTFRLPTSKESYIYLKQFQDERFIEQRKKGRWMAVDFYVSNYTAYQLTYKYHIGGVAIEKPIYCNTEYRDTLTNYVNSGRAYHDGNIKTVNDYYDKLYELYPTIRQEDIRIMIKYAWRCIYLLNYRKADICISSHTYKFWFLIGTLTRSPLRHFSYYRRKVCIKLRILYNRTGQKWDGYYYFTLTRAEYEEYLNSIKSRGRKKKWFTFYKKILFKIEDEANINGFNRVCLMRIKKPVLIGFSFYKPVLKCENPEVVLVREPLKFKDILTTSNNYKYICKSKQ